MTNLGRGAWLVQRMRFRFRTERGAVPLPGKTLPQRRFENWIFGLHWVAASVSERRNVHSLTREGAPRPRDPDGGHPGRQPGARRQKTLAIRSGCGVLREATLSCKPLSRSSGLEPIFRDRRMRWLLTGWCGRERCMWPRCRGNAGTIPSCITRNADRPTRHPPRRGRSWRVSTSLRRSFLALRRNARGSWTRSSA